MSRHPKPRRVGILTSGGDCPGLNAVIRSVAKTLGNEGVQVIGILEGFNGLLENKWIPLDDETTSGLLTLGGTILKTSRVKPHKMPQPDGSTVDMTDRAVATYKELNLDALVCLGGGGTAKNANRLAQTGEVNVVTCPKTIDNDVFGTDICFGFDTGMTIAAEAIDRLHTTASSHHRVMVVDIMGHNSGWLTLGSGLAGGADVILIPEIPYDMNIVAESLHARMRRGKRFSIVAVAEGAYSVEEARRIEKSIANAGVGKKKAEREAKKELLHTKEPVSAILAESLEQATGLETRITSLGYLQRGGVPTPADRILSTCFGTRAAELVLEGRFGNMVAKRGEQYVAVPLAEVAGKKRLVTLDHPWVNSAREVSTCMGDEISRGYA
jgi:6-phosphofructokinase